MAHHTLLEGYSLRADLFTASEALAHSPGLDLLPPSIFMEEAMSLRNLGQSLSSLVFINSWVKRRLVCGAEMGEPGVGLLGPVFGPRHLGGSHSLATATLRTGTCPVELRQPFLPPCSNELSALHLCIFSPVGS